MLEPSGFSKGEWKPDLESLIPADQKVNYAKRQDDDCGKIALAPEIASGTRSQERLNLPSKVRRSKKEKPRSA